MKKKKRRSQAYRKRVKKEEQVIDIEDARKRRKRKREEDLQKKKEKKQKKNIVTQRQAGKTAKRRLMLLVITAVMLAVIGFSVYNLISQKIAYRDAAAKEEALETEKAKLEQELTQINSPEYVQQQATKQLRMVMPDEMLYMLDSSPDATSSAITEDKVADE